MTVPFIPAIALLLGFELLESYWLSQSSTEALAALGFSAPLTTAMLAIVIANSIATNHLVCQTQSLSKHALKHNIVSALVIFTGLILMLSLVFMLLAPHLFELLGVKYTSIPDSFHLGPKPDLAPMVIEYSNIRLLGWIFLGLFWQTNGILRSLGFIKTASLLLCTWMICKIVLSYLFIHQFKTSELFASALQAAAYAHLLSDAVFAAISLAFVYRRFDLTQVKISGNHLFNTLKHLFLDGTTVMFQQLLLPLSIAVLTATVAYIGREEVALLGVMFRFEALALLLPMAFTASLPGIIASNWWAGKTNRVKSIISRSFASIFIFQLALACLLSYQAEWFSSWLASSASLQASFQHYISWVPFSFVGAGYVMMATSCFNAMGWCNDSFLLTLCHRICLLLPLTITGSLYAGTSGLFAGIALTHLLIIPFILYLSREHRMQRLSLPITTQNPNYPPTLTTDLKGSKL
jgi:Na+-driven multidrug efflux pump